MVLAVQRVRLLTERRGERLELARILRTSGRASHDGHRDVAGEGDRTQAVAVVADVVVVGRDVVLGDDAVGAPGLGRGIAAEPLGEVERERPTVEVDTGDVPVPPTVGKDVRVGDVAPFGCRRCRDRDGGGLGRRRRTGGVVVATAAGDDQRERRDRNGGRR